ncbi:MAG: LarC family nickel insertion protein [Oscillospiraceae bacterium]|jgi:uncharacterized protein (TIGR00299 family) protein|nr:LarC family nickel insertion protein [Oscillospiraceae bacterium]
MTKLHIDCSMGIAGDMLTAALLAVVPDRARAIRSLRIIAGSLPGLTFEVSEGKRGAVAGLHCSVFVNGTEEGEFSHRHYHGMGLTSVTELLSGLPIAPAARDNAIAIYNRIADAESRIHGEAAQLVHFHELGALDAVFDIAAICVLLELISPDSISASPVNLGGGTVWTAHGRLPVPAPATALILEGIPSYGDSELTTELATPTGAAVLAHFAGSNFSSQPLMSITAIGHGLGTKDFPNRSNAVRVTLGTVGAASDAPNGEISELACNIDDMTGEQLGRAAEILRSAGALDLSFIPITGKKNRPGVILLLLCAVRDESKFAKLVLRHTSTFGVRVSRKSRYELERWFTDGGKVKHGKGYGIEKSKNEFDLTQTESEI